MHASFSFFLFANAAPDTRENWLEKKTSSAF